MRLLTFLITCLLIIATLGLAWKFIKQFDQPAHQAEQDPGRG